MTGMRHPFVDALANHMETGDETAIRAVLAPDAVFWHNHDDVDMNVEDGLKGVAMLRTIVDGLKLEVVSEEPVPDGVVIQTIFRATVKHSGKELAGRNCIFLREKDGKLARLEEYVDPTFGAQLS